jgi:hypothetical protein
MPAMLRKRAKGERGRKGEGEGKGAASEREGVSEKIDDSDEGKSGASQHVAANIEDAQSILDRWH